MSVYSGFATRNQESTYFKFVNKLVSLLSLEILSKRLGGKDHHDINSFSVNGDGGGHLGEKDHQNIQSPACHGEAEISGTPFFKKYI
jgi:hypothetical protein